MSILRKRSEGQVLYLVVAIGLGMLFHMCCRLGGRVAAQTPMPFTAEYYAGVQERFGVGLNTGIPVSIGGEVRQARITDYDVGGLYAGWYSDWGFNRDPLRPGGIRYAQLIQVRASVYPTNTRFLTEAVRANPSGQLWIIGNEPEAKYGQGNRTPGEYAQIYHDLYMQIKGTPAAPGLDPMAWIAIGGVVEPTPLRLKWLDRVLDAYQQRFGAPMPVDVWNIHMQMLQEMRGTPADPYPWGAEIPAGLPDLQGELFTIAQNADPSTFRQLITAFRTWMKQKGFQNQPLMVSEYGVLMPSGYLADTQAEGDQRVVRFMQETFGFLVNERDASLGYPADGNRLVQQWLWYSLNDQPYDGVSLGFNGGLFSHVDPQHRTIFGDTFHDSVVEWMGKMGAQRVFLPAVQNRVVRGWGSQPE
jgi:hypothetical protein